MVTITVASLREALMRARADEEKIGGQAGGDPEGDLIALNQVGMDVVNEHVREMLRTGIANCHGLFNGVEFGDRVFMLGLRAGLRLADLMRAQDLLESESG